MQTGDSAVAVIRVQCGGTRQNVTKDKAVKNFNC